MADLDTICAAPRKNGAILGVDNTFATPLNQRPLALGADVAMQSVTKFIGGHSDLLCGIVTVRDANLLAALRRSREFTGATPGTLETFLAVRGARTLALRLERAQRNAMTLAQRLEPHPNVTLTRYPGLTSHPTHEAAQRQLKGFGTIISCAPQRAVPVPTLVRPSPGGGQRLEGVRVHRTGEEHGASDGVTDVTGKISCDSRDLTLHAGPSDGVVTVR